MDLRSARSAGGYAEIHSSPICVNKWARRQYCQGGVLPALDTAQPATLGLALYSCHIAPCATELLRYGHSFVCKVQWNATVQSRKRLEKHATFLPDEKPQAIADQPTLCNKWIASQHPDTCFTPMMPQGLCTIKTETRKLTPTRLSPVHNSALFLDSHPMLSDNSSSCHGQAGGPAQIWTTLCFQWTSDQIRWPEAMPKFAFWTTWHQRPTCVNEWTRQQHNQQLPKQQ